MSEYNKRKCPNKNCDSKVEYEQEICDGCGVEIIWLDLGSYGYKSPYCDSNKPTCLKCIEYQREYNYCKIDHYKNIRNVGFDLCDDFELIPITDKNDLNYIPEPEPIIQEKKKSKINIIFENLRKKKKNKYRQLVMSPPHMY